MLIQKRLEQMADIVSEMYDFINNFVDEISGEDKDEWELIPYYVRRATYLLKRIDRVR